jgi:hypothetical protein
MALTDTFYIALITCLTYSKSSFSLCRVNTTTRIFAAQLVSYGSHLVTEIINRPVITSVSFNIRRVRGLCPLHMKTSCIWDCGFQALEGQNCLRWAVLSPTLLTRSIFHASTDCCLFGIQTIYRFSRIEPSVLFLFIIKSQVSWHLIDFFQSKDWSLAH